MATSKNEGAKVRLDAFIKNVRPDPGSTEQIVLMQGYVGESANENNIRLYSDASLSDYIDIPKEDIVHSVPNADDALGGSQLWVKQSSNVLYNDPNAYTQGDMYNSYMNNNYTPGDYNNQAFAATAVCPGPVLTRLIICRLSRFIVCTRNIQCIITRNNQRTICRPCFVTPPLTPQTQVTINPGGGGFNDPYGGYGGGENAGYGDYTGGDMYNDYMTNTYDGGSGSGEFGPVAATSPQICLQPQATLAAWCGPSRLVICATIRVICRTINIIQCITPRGHRTICRPCWVTPPYNPQTPVNPGGGGFDNPYGGYGGGENAGYGDYTGGDIYNDYMTNTYDGGGGYGDFGPAPATNPQICLQPATLAVWCGPSRLTICPTVRIICRTINIIQCVTPRGLRTICRPCWVTPPFNPQTPVNPGGGGFNDPYGGYGGGENAGYGDYTGGDMYNDYMTNTYDGGAGSGEFGPVAATNPQICLQPRPSVINICPTVLVNCPTSPIRCPIRTVPWRCPVTFTRLRSVCIICITANGIRTPCRPCPVTPQTPATPGVGGGFNPYEF